MSTWADATPTSPDAKLAELAAATQRSVPDLTSEAVDRLYRTYVGDPARGPKAPTAPFSKQFSALPAEVVVRQVTPATFELDEPVRYTDGGRTFVVPLGDISDLASVPMSLTWLFARYGQHTLAALLHDHLQRHLVTRQNPRDGDPERVQPEEADTIFRRALQQSRVPFLRRWVMWAAVSLRTVFRSGLAGAAAVVLWSLVFVLLGLSWPVLLLTAAVSPAVDGWLPLVVLAGAFLLPLLLSGLWGRRWRTGLISSLALVVVALPALLAGVAGGFYLAVEAVVRAVLAESTALIVRPPTEEDQSGS